MAKPGQNEGFRVLDDFACDAVTDAALQQGASLRQGRNEGVNLVEELTIECGDADETTCNKPPMKPSQFVRLVHNLEMVAKRPGMFFGEPNVQAACCHLMGFRSALIGAFDLDYGVQDAIILDRGWELPTASGPGLEHQMMQKGLSPSEVIAELITIEIAVLQKLAGGSSSVRSV